MNTITKDSLQQMLDNNNTRYVEQVVGRALVRLFERQTQAEQASNVTNQNNNIGFAGCDAKSGSITAKFFIKHNRLESWMVSKWVKKGSTGYSRLSKYHRQLNEVVKQRATSKVGQ